jgi:hypothetical protein
MDSRRYASCTEPGSQASTFWHVRRSGCYSEYSISRCLCTVVRSLLYQHFECNTHTHPLRAFFRRCVFPPHTLCFTGLCVRHAVWQCVFPPLCVSLVCVYATLFDTVFPPLCVSLSVYATLFVWLCPVSMVQRTKAIVAHYEERSRKMPSVPRYSYGRGLLWKDGAPNLNFFTYLFGHQEPAITHHVTAVTTHKYSSSLGLGRNIYFLIDLQLLIMLHLLPSINSHHP